MSKETVLNSFVIEAGKAIASLQSILSNPEEAEDLLHNLGYTVPDSIDATYSELKTALVSFSGSLTSIIDKLNDDDIDEAALLRDLLTLLGSLNELIQLIRQLPAKIDTVLANFQDFLNNSGIKDSFAIRLTDYIIIKFLDEYHPTISSLLRLLGLVEVTFVEEGTYNPDFFLHEIKWDRFQYIYTNPRKNFELSYGWGSAEMNYQKLFNNIKAFAWSIHKFTYNQPDIELPAGASLPALSSENNPLLLRVPLLSGMIAIGDGPEDQAAFLADLLVYPIIDPTRPNVNGIAFAPFLEGTVSQQIPIGSLLELILSADMQIGGNVGVAVKSDDGISLFADPNNFKGIFSALLKRAGDEKTFLFSFGGFEIFLSDVSFATRLIVTDGSEPEFITELSFTCASGVSSEEADSFIKKFLQNLAFDFKSTIAYSTKRGVYFIGSGGLEIQIPLQLTVGPLKIEEVCATLQLPEKESIPISIDTSFSLLLGPLFATVQKIGFSAELGFIGPQGQPGPVKFDISFKPPTAIGLSLDTSVVKAGGFLSIKPNEYIGALELEIKSFNLAIKAIAIINTNLPGGGFSLLVIITAEFNPIQLGYGFSLNGLGGLFGYKRSFEAQELRLGLKTKALDSILFPKDVIANINRIVSDLKRVFPIGNNFLIGPMIKIGWGTTLVTAEIGVLIQVPNPVIIAILGIIRLQLPDPKEPVLLLQINFLGVIDFEKKMFSLDASLSDSRILVMTITGDFALRIGWGSPAVFIFSSGGFHPDFKEAPVELQHMERLGIQVINEKELKLGIDTYFALTTNTVQIGARARFWAQSGGYTAVAEVGFDALIQFDPFFFTVAIYLTGRVTGPFIDIGIDVRGNLSGPNQWHVWGYAKAKVIGFEIEIPFDETFGDVIEELSAGLQKVLDLLKEEIPKSSNWKTITVVTGPPKISLREHNTGPDDMLIHPNTTLSFNQRAVPLETNIEKFGNKGIDGARQYSLSATMPDLALGLGGTPLYDLFAPGQFFNIPKDQQLSRPSFERFESGQSFNIITSTPVNGTAVSKEIDYEVVYIRRKKPAAGGVMNLLGAQMVMLLADGGAAAKSKFSLEKNRPSHQAPPVIGIKRPGYVVANSSDLSTVGTETFSNQTMAYNAQQAGGNEGTVVFSTHEL